VVDEDHAGPMLRSVVYGQLWPSREPVRMECYSGGCLGARWQTQPHSCGIHAFKERHDAAAFPAMWEARRFSPSELPRQCIVGQVSLWGRVIEHERGYRGEIAYPYALLLSDAQRHLAASLARRYGVDVLVEPRAA